MYLRISMKVVATILTAVIASMALTYDMKLASLPNDFALIASLVLAISIFGISCFLLGKVWRSEIMKLKENL